MRYGHLTNVGYPGWTAADVPARIPTFARYPYLCQLEKSKFIHQSTCVSRYNKPFTLRLSLPLTNHKADTYCQTMHCSCLLNLNVFYMFHSTLQSWKRHLILFSNLLRRKNFMVRIQAFPTPLLGLCCQGKGNCCKCQEICQRILWMVPWPQCLPLLMPLKGHL